MMRRNSVNAIIKREWGDLIYSPVAYSVIAIFLIISGVSFFYLAHFFFQKQASLRSFFVLMPYIFSFTISALTMKSYSEEYNRGTDELLGTLPISSVEVLTGKFLSTFGFIAVMLAFTLGYPISISFIGDLDKGAVFSGYVGLLLLALAYTAIGIFASSLSKNSIMAFFLSFSITLILSLMHLSFQLLPGAVVSLLQPFSSSYHIYNLSRGVLDSRDILYFLSITFVGLYLTWFINQKER